MLKNRLIQLTELTDRRERIGSKLTLPIPVNETSSQFQDIEKLLSKFSSNNDDINQMRSLYKKTANPVKQREIVQTMNRIAKGNQNLMHTIETKLKKINEQQKQKYDKGIKSDTLRVAQINQKANQLIKQYREVQEKFTTGVKDTIRRQATMLQGDISETEVENIMKNPQQGQEMLRAKLLDHPSVQLQNAVSDIIDKYRDILQLEKNMNQCLQMMQELALLVAMTGQQLQNIEEHVTNADHYTKNADQKLVEAKKHHKSAKKKMCCIIMLLIAAIGAVLIPVLITQL